MSSEEQLYGLAEHVRTHSGDHILRSRDQFVPWVSDQAPDLAAEAQALAAAFEADVAARIGQAADPDLEAEAAAAEIAGREAVSLAAARAAVNVARRLDAAPAVAAAVEKPFWQNKWVMGGAAAIALLVVFQMAQQRPPPPAQPSMPCGPSQPSSACVQPPVQPGTPGAPGLPGAPPPTAAPGAPAPPGTAPGVGPTGTPIENPIQGPPRQAPSMAPAAQDSGTPFLAAPGAQMPLLNPSYMRGTGTYLHFQLRTAAGNMQVTVLVPEGWDNGEGVYSFQRVGHTGEPIYSIGMGPFAPIMTAQGPSRVSVPLFASDPAQVGGFCLAFNGNPGDRDVPLRGSTMCAMDRSCTQVHGCAKVR